MTKTKKKTYAKIKIGVGVVGGAVAFTAGLAALPAVGVGIATWATVRWLDK